MSTSSRRGTRNLANRQGDELGEPNQMSQKRKHPAEEPDARKAPGTADGRPGSLSWILSSDKSPLCKIDLSKIINEDTWICLPSQDREELSTLLPPTVYPFFEASLPSYHPSRSEDTESDTPTLELDGIEAEPSSFLNCPHFGAAQITFQDHLYSGWHGRRHREDIAKYQAGVAEGSRHAPWKDDLWFEDQRREEESENNAQLKVGRRSREALAAMVSRGIIKRGDVIAYRRSFPDSKTIVEKDVLVLNTSGFVHVTVVAPAKTETSLPLGMLLTTSNPLTDVVLQQMTVETLEQLEAAILDMDSRIPYERRSGGNSWKRFTLWRLKEELEQLGEYGGDTGSHFGPRGPREKQGTFFYLRGAYLPQT